MAGRVHSLAGYTPLARDFPSLVRLRPRSRLRVSSFLGKLRWYRHGAASPIRLHPNSGTILLFGCRGLLYSSTGVDRYGFWCIPFPRSVVFPDRVTRCQMVFALKITYPTHVTTCARIAIPTIGMLLLNNLHRYCYSSASRFTRHTRHSSSLRSKKAASTQASASEAHLGATSPPPQEGRRLLVLVQHNPLRVSQDLTCCSTSLLLIDVYYAPCKGVFIFDGVATISGCV